MSGGELQEEGAESGPRCSEKGTIAIGPILVRQDDWIKKKIEAAEAVLQTKPLGAHDCNPQAIYDEPTMDVRSVRTPNL